ncbi:MAG TPA: dTDP-4-amino-4,6-dideoxygalactose transaminase [Holophagaceae bacterium]|nr:dTDP-4-amino-4,6-dideoxygalactose transaminase [Holophagaceae bacterium]
MADLIPFNRPHLTGQEPALLAEALEGRRLSGDGPFTKRCSAFFETRYGLSRALLTTSCTDALEMAAILSGIGPGDEVIAPSYTFVSTVNPFLLRGATVRFVDSRPDHPGMDESQIEALVGPRTRGILPVHYAGVACDMDLIQAVASRHGLFIVEDAAQAIEARYKGRQLGTFGELGAFSFHETKNLQCGEGGLLLVNSPALTGRAEIIREKGTNRSAFFRGEIDKYGWVDIGSSFLPADPLAALLWAQLERLEGIQARRMLLWSRYAQGLAPLAARGMARLPAVPAFAEHNGHLFYLVLEDLDSRTRLIAHLKSQGIQAVFHYQSLHRSPFFQSRHDGRPLPFADRYSDGLLRLPLFHDLQESDQDRVIQVVLGFFGG